MNLADFRIENERAVATVKFLRPNVAKLKVTGHVSADLVEPTLEQINGIFAPHRKAVVINDLAELRGYDPKVRFLCTRWAVCYRHDIHQLLLYSSASTVRMGVTVANLALTPLGLGVSLFDNQHSFRAAIGGALRWADGG